MSFKIKIDVGYTNENIAALAHTFQSIDSEDSSVDANLILKLEN
jgi:hypothetical protein